MRKFSALLLALLLSFSLLLTGCDIPFSFEDKGNNTSIKGNGDVYEESKPTNAESVLEVPPYSGSPYIQINEGVPRFTEEQLTTVSYEKYAPLDSLGRCGVTMACIGTDLMPTEDREEIGSVKPSGWINKKYDSDLVSGGYLYNRSHLIGFQLTGENANERNLITGTRYFNVEGMLPFENMVADYLKEETEHHVMYRVTPIYDGNNLVARGVQMEAYSVEDNGEGICFNVYIYNVQPGIVIDYATGESWLDTENSPQQTEKATEKSTEGNDEASTYVLNTGTKKIHKLTCSSVADIRESNKEIYSGTKASLLEEGYSTCGVCKP